MLGTRQHGLPEFRVARLPEDAELLERRAPWSIDLLARGPRARATPSTSCCAWALERPLRRARGRADRGLTARCASSPAQYRGRRLTAPRGARTAADAGPRARGALQHPRARSTGLRVLDLYAGSGALGIEALSRGAAERDVRRLGCRPRRGRCGRTSSASGADAARVFRADALSFLRGAARHGERWDLVLLRPAI